MTGAKLPPVGSDRIADARARDIPGVAERCGAKLRRVGRDHVGPCPAGCASTDGFAVTPSKNIFICRPSGAGGDAIDLVMHLQGLDFRAAVDFILGEDTRPASPRKLKAAAPEPEDATNLAAAARIVREMGPVHGSSGERYLSETRRIDTAAIVDVLERTDAIGWHPAVYFNEPVHKLHGQLLGCIVGIMSDAKTGRPTGAISRTYIGPELQKVGKAKTLGRPAGIVRLSQDDDVLEGLHLAEGIESGLSALSVGFRPTWSTGSTTLLRIFPILTGVESLTILADHDEGNEGVVAARECEGRWKYERREVRILLWGDFGDINDALKAAL